MTYEPGIYRTLNDCELPPNFESRTKAGGWHGQAQAPEIVQLSDRLGRLNIRQIKLNAAWQKFQDCLSPTAVSNYMHHQNAGLNNAGWPKRMCVTTGNNLLEILEISAQYPTWGRVKTYHYPDPPPNILLMKMLILTGLYDHTLIHRFNIVRRNGTLTDTPKGKALYALVSDVTMWVEMERLVKV